MLIFEISTACSTARFPYGGIAKKIADGRLETPSLSYSNRPPSSEFSDTFRQDVAHLEMREEMTLAGIKSEIWRQIAPAQKHPLKQI
ncbi:hypothetical protein cyc_04108 [Cyclospora cayetanensis]|uniref:Uncharacterized protein n=1 Tax=Cyclospora cayetanensis TaxID=88456 RepID=A0A1D3D6J5_9EIME|nr:hypothetical protein cyc_04108 [Cyclospora cayetanensis]